MNRSELIDRVSARIGYATTGRGFAHGEMVRFLREVETVVCEELAAGRRVDLLGFGVFATRKRKARTARNPHTGEQMQVEAKTVPVFRPGTRLKESTATGKVPLPPDQCGGSPGSRRA